MIILVMRMSLMMNCLRKSNSTKHLLIVALFKTKNIFYDAYLSLVLKLRSSKIIALIVLIALFRKLLRYILKKENK